MSEPGFLKTNFPKTVNAFIAANKDKFSFEIDDISGGDGQTKIKTDIAAGNIPDIFGYNSNFAIKDLVDNKLLLNVEEYFRDSKKVKKSDFTEEGLRGFSLDGGKNVFGFPQESLICYFMANKELFDKYKVKYPKTIQELKDVAKVFNANGIVPIAVGSKGGNPAHFFFANIYYQLGDPKAMVDLPQTKNFTLPAVIKAADICRDLAAAGVFPSDTIANGDFAPAVALYNEGKAAMILSFPWMLGSFDDKIVAKSEMINMPEVPGAINKPNSFTVGGIQYGLVVSAKSYHDPAKHDAMVASLDMLLSKDAFQGVVESGRMIPYNMSIDPKWARPLYSKVMAFYKNFKLYPHIWGAMPYPASADVFSTANDELWAQAIDGKQFAKQVQDSINKLSK